MLELDGRSLTIEDVVNVSRNGLRVSLDPKARKDIVASNNELMKIVESDETCYGINTGFGSFKDKKLNRDDISRLSRNIILSHACATGDYLPFDVVRAAMLIRANSFATGTSGVSIELVETLLNVLNKDLYPLIPKLGSLAACGDLCLLSHLGLAITQPNPDEDQARWNSWRVVYHGVEYPARIAMEMAGIKQHKLGPKEGLALTNGSTFTAGLLALNTHDSLNLWKACVVALGLSMESLTGVPAAFDERIHKARGMDGQILVAKYIRELTNGSTLILQANRLQDAYTLRCSPQVQGPVHDMLMYISGILTKELNASTDNPLIFGEDVISGGNFHGEPLGILSDSLKAIMCSLAGISERRLERNINGTLSNGLPSMQSTKDQGLNSGLMIAQYTAASLALRNQTLASADTIRSLPTSENQEDYNSNAWNSVLFGQEIISNTTSIICWEIFAAVRGITIRLMADPSKQLGKGTMELYTLLNRLTPFCDKDYYMGDDHKAIISLVKSNEFTQLFKELTTEKVKKLNLQTPSGTRDFHPWQMEIRDKIMTTIKHVFKSHGCQEIDTPVFERRDVLLGQYGDGNKLVYDLDDQGTPLSLRYDLTVPFARYVATNNITVMKRSHIGKVYRRDHPSIVTGRYREFFQCDLDICGKSSPMVADAEILHTVYSVLTKVDVADFVVKLNHRKLLTEILSYCDVPTDIHDMICSSIDKLDKQSWESVRAELLLKGATDSSADKIGKYMTVRGELFQTLAQLRAMFETMPPQIEQIFSEMELLFTYLKSFGIDQKFEFDMSLARGLGYYTGVIFEAVIVQQATVDGVPVRIGSIAAGGRYDELIGQFSNRQVPAVGCSFGIERLFTLAEQKLADNVAKDKVNLDVLVIPIINKKGNGLNETSEVMKLTSELWQQGISSQFPHDLTLKMKDYIEFCISNQVKYMLIMGENEINAGYALVKNIAKNEQSAVERNDVVGFLATALKQ